MTALRVVFLVLLGVRVVAAQESGSISGLVTLASGDSEPGWSVAAIAASDNRPAVYFAKCNDRGEFAIPKVSPGEYALVLASQSESKRAVYSMKALEALASRPPNEWTGVDWVLARHIQSDARSNPDRCRVKPDRRTVVKLVAPELTRTSLRLVDNRKQPVKQLEIGLILLGARQLPRNRAAEIARTDEFGLASWSSIAAGKYAIQATVGDWYVGLGQVEVNRGTPRISRRLGAHSIIVIVQDWRRRPVSRVSVSALSRSPAGWMGTNTRPLRRLQSKRGQFEIPHLHPGTYDVTVSSGVVTGVTRGVAVPGDGRPSRAVVRLEPSGAVRVVVTAADGTPLGNETVRAVGIDPDRGGVTGGTNERGEFKLTLPCGVWRIELGGVRESAGTSIRRVRVREGKEVTCNLVLVRRE